MEFALPLVAELGVETRRTVACTLHDMTVKDTILRRQIDTMLLQEACKQLDSANKRFCSVPLTSCTPHVTRSSSVTHLPPASRCASPLHAPAAPSAKRRVFRVPVTSSTPQLVVTPSFPTFSFLHHSHCIRSWLGLLRQ